MAWTSKWDTQDERPIPIYGEDPDSQLADLKHGVDWFESESSVAGLTRTKQGGWLLNQLLREIRSSWNKSYGIEFHSRVGIEALATKKTENLLENLLE